VYSRFIVLKRSREPSHGHEHVVCFMAFGVPFQVPSAAVCRPHSSARRTHGCYCNDATSPRQWLHAPDLLMCVCGGLHAVCSSCLHAACGTSPHPAFGRLCESIPNTGSRYQRVFTRNLAHHISIMQHDWELVSDACRYRLIG
jgi:hypothetical protein